MFEWILNTYNFNSTHGIECSAGIKQSNEKEVIVTVADFIDPIGHNFFYWDRNFFNQDLFETLILF